MIGEQTDIKPHIIIPYYVYSSDMGCVGQKFCGLIFGLSSKYGHCTAKNEYFAKFFYGGTWDDLEEEQKAQKIAAAKKQISRLLHDGFIKNIGTRAHRKLILGYIENDADLGLTERGQNVTNESQKGQNVTTRGQNVTYLPIIYNKYILKSKSSLETGQMTDKEILESLFNYFWGSYPRREKKKHAKTSFFRLTKTDLEKLLKILPLIVERYKETQKQFIPLPTSFINGELWEDEYFLAQKISKKGAAVVEDDDLVGCLMRFRALSDGDEVSLHDVDAAVLSALGMNEAAAADMVMIDGMDVFKSEVLSVWSEVTAGAVA